MRDGTIQQCDTPAQLFDQPRNVFVATFMGSPPMNL
jgi:multiple sugar transport system ATP-binding protein